MQRLLKRYFARAVHANRAAVALIAIACSLAACSGSGQSIAVAPIAEPAAPTLPVSAAFAATGVVTPAASASSTSLTLPLPGNATYAGTAVFPVTSVPPDLSLRLTYSTAPPAGLSAFDVARANANVAARRKQDVYSTSTVYACFAANYLVTLAGVPQYQFVLPPAFNLPGVVYYLALWQSGRWISGYGGPGAIAASAAATTVSIAGGFPFVIPPNGKVCVALYGRYETAPSPVAATPPPSIPLNVTAAPVAIAGGTVTIPAGTADTLTVDTGDAPATAVSTCDRQGVATLAGSPGTTLTLTGTSAGSCTITLIDAAGKTAVLTIVVAGAASPVPTPQPQFATSTLSFSSVGESQTVAFTEPGYSGALTASGTCAGIAAITPSTASGPSATFTITAVGAGSCAFTVTDANGRAASVAIGVTTLGGTIQSKTRKP